MSDDTVLAELAASLGELEEPTDVVDVSKLNSFELLTRFAEVRQAIYELPGNQMTEPETREARDLHSQRVALLLEMHNRGLR